MRLEAGNRDQILEIDFMSQVEEVSELLEGHLR
jgi:hypothetical protein